MARGGRMSVKIDFSAVERNLQVFLRRVERGTRIAILGVAHQILDRSLELVPRDTDTLAQSSYVEVTGSRRNFEAVVGYGGNGDPINPKTGMPASSYMVVVHEDLSAHHPIGQAKYLEQAVTEYASRFGPLAGRIIKSESGLGR